jgi:ribose/xylose/arabinose/galactoside ABC-type transport system permease subunit
VFYDVFQRVPIFFFFCVFLFGLWLAKSEFGQFLRVLGGGNCDFGVRRVGLHIKMHENGKNPTIIELYKDGVLIF